LSDLVTSAPSVAVFRSRLKTHLFNISYPSPLWLYSARAVTLSCFGHYNRNGSSLPYRLLKDLLSEFCLQKSCVTHCKLYSLVTGVYALNQIYSTCCIGTQLTTPVSPRLTSSRYSQSNTRESARRDEHELQYRAIWQVNKHDELPANTFILNVVNWIVIRWVIAAYIYFLNDLCSAKFTDENQGALGMCARVRLIESRGQQYPIRIRIRFI